VIHARTPTNYNFLRPKGSIISEQGFCGSMLTHSLRQQLPLDGVLKCGRTLSRSEKSGEVAVAVADWFMGRLWSLERWHKGYACLKGVRRAMALLP